MTLTAERNTLMDMTTTRPPVAPPMWAPVPPPAPARGRSVTAIVLAMVATLLAAAALVVALTRPVPEPAPAAEEYTPAEIASAKAAVCDTFEVVDRAAMVETNRDDTALARISVINSAGALESTVAAQPALDDQVKEKALDAAAKSRLFAAGKPGNGEAAWASVVSDVNNAVAAMRKICA